MNIGYQENQQVDFAKLMAGREEVDRERQEKEKVSREKQLEIDRLREIIQAKEHELHAEIKRADGI